MTDFDVVVVGAGPVGLLAAIELTLGGSNVVILERLATPSTASKALGIGPLGTEVLQRRGMSHAIAAAEERTFAIMKMLSEKNGPDARGKGSRFSGHFAGLSLLRKDVQKEPERHMHPVDQHAVEAMLGERVQALGIELRRGYEVTGFTQQSKGMEVEWSSADATGTMTCSYLLGCDGGRSVVRKLAGFKFPGTPPSLTMYQAVAEVDHPERLLPAGWQRTSGGVFAYGFLPNRLVLLDFSGPPADRDAPVTRDEIETVLRRISQQDVRLATLESASRWTDNTRLVDSYRKARVLLAGDAAHIHSPFGGQGLSLGLVDAANIGWKLAAVVRGEMPETLLDSYTEERRPAAEAVIANTLAQAAIMRPDAQAGAMRDLMVKLLQLDDVNRLVGEMMSGLATRYEFGSPNASAGRLIANMQIRSGKLDCSLYDVMQDGGGVLLDASPNQQATQVVEARSSRVRCIAVEAGPSMLIRPDACIAWVGEQGNLEGLHSALGRWFNYVDEVSQAS